MNFVVVRLRCFTPCRRISQLMKGVIHLLILSSLIGFECVIDCINLGLLVNLEIKRNLTISFIKNKPIKNISDCSLLIYISKNIF